MPNEPTMDQSDEELMSDDLDNAAPYDLGWEIQ